MANAPVVVRPDVDVWTHPHPHLGRLPSHLHEAFLDAMMARASFPARYVRLNIDAVA